MGLCETLGENANVSEVAIINYLLLKISTKKYGEVAIFKLLTPKINTKMFQSEKIFPPSAAANFTKNLFQNPA